jgi:integrase
LSASEPEDVAFTNFQKVLKKKSERTQENYLWVLEHYRRANFIDQYSFMLEGKAEEIEDKIKDYLGKIKRSHAQILLGALRLFYAANRININWDHVLLFMPTGQAKTLRPYLKAEIENALRIADDREAAAILLMSTGGLRIGGLLGLKVEDLLFLESENLYCLKVYAGDTLAEYLTFITPQASQTLRKYIKKRTSGPVFLAKNDSGYPADEDSLSCAIDGLLDRAGVKKPGEVQLNHGFRKFFRTTIEIAGIHDDFAERLLGHKKEKLKKVYSQPQPMELYTASQYSKAIDALTFSL